jgi:hypothetical protein
MAEEKIADIPTEGVAPSLADLAMKYEGFGGTSLITQLASFPLNQYIFRGQSDESWGLQPSIERLRLPLIGREGAEGLVLRAFSRRAHHYVQNLPAPGETLEWLAVMRHYGAPTRLLDCTASPYIAAFFATAEAREDVAPVIWGFHAGTLLACAISKFHEAYPEDLIFRPRPYTEYPRGDELFQHMQRLRDPAVVVPVRPFKFNDRLARQQGWFLCSNSLSVTLESSLLSLLRDTPYGPNCVKPLIRMRLRPGGHASTLLELAKMNITYETLFPGLDGFARSLETHLKIREVAWTSHPEDWL